MLPVNEDQLEASVDEIGHQGTVVSPYGLDAFTVHLVVNLGSREIETSVSLLVDQQVWIVHLETQCHEFAR